jgi:ribosome biogenesis GTPase
LTGRRPVSNVAQGSRVAGAAEPARDVRTGLVVRLEANRPTVRLDDGQEWLCHLRGNIRRHWGAILVGDRVDVAPAEPGVGVIWAVKPRGVTLDRPPVANVTGLVVVFSLVEPPGSFDILDRRLVLAELLGLDVVLAAHKADLVMPPDREVLRPWGDLYPLVWTSVRTGEGMDALAERIGPGIWVLTGESGVGKSSLLKHLAPDAPAVVQALGSGGRGRQTTRVVSLVPLAGDPGRYLADTPGFSRLDLPPVTLEDLRAAFPEWREARCRFHDCRHLGEPGCEVEAWAEAGRVSPRRFAHYRRYAAEVMGRP